MQHKRKYPNNINKFLWMYGIIISFLSVKIAPITFSILFFIECTAFSHQRETINNYIQLSISILIAQILLNSYFIKINPLLADLNFIIAIIQNQPITKWYFVLYRISFSIPLLFIKLQVLIL
ncbi:MAG: hypothetical protein ACTSRZ_01735 [Promethearchaeota archaeon]